MMTRSAKLLLLAGIAFYFTLVVFNNLTDFNSNYEFIRHVLSMDSILPGNHAMWRAMPWPVIHLVFYWIIIAWEFATGILAWGDSFVSCEWFADRLLLSTQKNAWRWPRSRCRC